MPDLPSGTVTFLFTDIEGSTRLLEELGDRYADLLAEHRRALRAAFREHGGVEVDTQGDAFFVAFARASSALTAAATGQQALVPTGIRVRMGVHSGEPLLTDGGYVGRDVHRAARICAVAHGGQVVVSERTAAMAGSAFALRDLGRHRLKDLGEPERLFQLGDGEFPPLRSLNATNLPTQPAPLVGRVREVEEARALLRGGETRLLTLTGAGGSGKTRLALQVAAELVDEFEGGVFWVSLAAVTEAELVVQTIGEALGATVAPGYAIGEKRVLLLLDNFEHVIGAAPALADLLAACPNLHLLVTSRAALRLSAEQEYEVQPLPERDAVEMFTQRARAVRPAFETDVSVAEICDRLDCLPLAIELAAARVRLLTPAELVRRLERRLPLLTGGARDAPARQRTLRATIEWSHELLAPDEQRVFANLAVFAGGFTLEAAELICDADVDALSNLVEQSLVRRWASGRYGMLETVREFALEQFEVSANRDEIRDRLLQHVSALVLRLRPEREGRWRRASLRAIDTERDNVRAALAWSVSGGNAIQGLELAAALGRFWIVRDHAEGSRWLSATLEAAEQAPAGLRAEALRALGSTAFLSRDMRTAAEAFNESLALLRDLGDPYEIAVALDRVASVQIEVGRLHEARASVAESLALFDELGNREGAMYPLEKLGWLERLEGNHELAAQWITESLRRAREFGDSWWEAIQVGSLAEWAFEDGRLDEAERRLIECLGIAVELEDPSVVAHCVAYLAAVAARKGDAERAGRLWGGLATLERRGAPPLDARFPAALAAEAAMLDWAVASGRELSAETVIEYASRGTYRAFPLGHEQRSIARDSRVGA